jgi:hypothetical protein
MVFSTIGPCRGIISSTKLKLSSARREPPFREHGSRGVAIVGAVTRQLLMRHCGLETDLACALSELYSVEISNGAIIKCSYELCMTRPNGFSSASKCSAVEGAVVKW